MHRTDGNRAPGALVARPFAAVVIAAACLTGAGPAAADPQTPTWRLLGSPGVALDAPAVDLARRRQYLVTATDAADQFLTVWSTGLDGAEDWVPLETRWTFPAPAFWDRARQTAGFMDARRNRLVVDLAFPDPVFPSSEYGLRFYLSLDSLVWHQAPSAGALAYGLSTAPDPAGDRVLSFGGMYFSRLAGPPGYTSETDALSLADLATGSVLVPDARGAAGPAGRAYAAIGYDALRKRLLVHGGQFLFGGPFPALLTLDELWELDLSGTPTWTFLPPVAPVPPARFGHHAFVDSLQDRLLMWGGSSGTPPSGLGMQLWKQPLAIRDQARWSALPSLGFPPASPSTFVYDPERRVLSFAGGVSPAGRGGRFELALDGTPTWSTPVAELAEPPTGGEPLPDELRDRLLLVFRNRLWTATLTQPPQWSPLPCSGAHDTSGTLVVDPVRDRVLCVGGLNHGLPSSDVAALPRRGGAWTPVVTTGEHFPARISPAVVYDASGDRLLVFGGVQADTAATRDLLNDVWALSLAGAPSWTRLDRTAPRPSARVGAAMVLDSDANRLVVWGGLGRVSSTNDFQAFSLDSLTWTELQPAGPGPSWHGPFVSWDPLRRRMLVPDEPPYQTIPSLRPLPVWALSLAGTPAWTRLALQGVGPQRAGELAGWFDAANDRWVLQRPSTNRDYPSQIWLLPIYDWRTPEQPLLVSSAADTAGAHVAWWVGRDASQLVALERRADQGPWTDLGPRVADAGGYVRVDDRVPESGHVYGYRLRLGDGSGTRYSAEVSLEFPLAFRAAAIACANPSLGALTLSAVLPPGLSGARIELYDLTGRRRFTRELAPGGRTPEVISFGSDGVRPGLYIARITARGRVLASRRLTFLR